MPGKGKINILLVVCWPVGGIRTFIRYIYNRFDRSRYRITVLAQDQPELRALLEDIKEMDVTYISSVDDPRGARFVSLVARTIIFGKYDLIHSHGFMAGVYSTLPAKLSRTRHMMTSHDVLLPKQFQGAKGFLRKAAFSFFLPMIDVIHSVSQDAEDNLLESVPSLGRFRKKLAVISNGIEVERFLKKEKRDLHGELSLQEGTFLIGFLGRFMSQKGFRLLVDAVESVSKNKSVRRRFAVVAFGFGGFIREDKEYIKAKGLTGYFHFLPFAPNIAPALKALDVIAMPSLWEACPLLPMEAMVAGVPLIGTDCIGLREILTNTPCRVIPAGDSPALASAIEDEINMPTRSEAEGFSREAARRFDVKDKAGRLEKLLLSAMEGKSIG